MIDDDVGGGGGGGASGSSAGDSSWSALDYQLPKELQGVGVAQLTMRNLDGRTAFTDSAGRSWKLQYTNNYGVGVPLVTGVSYIPSNRALWSDPRDVRGPRIDFVFDAAKQQMAWQGTMLFDSADPKQWQKPPLEHRLALPFSPKPDEAISPFPPSGAWQLVKIRGFPVKTAPIDAADDYAARGFEIVSYDRDILMAVKVSCANASCDIEAV